jgi:asparagine synthase (glutamine-hydrolysing)
MLIGAWGSYGVERLRETAGRAGAEVEQVGPLAIAGGTGVEVGGWRCWLWGSLYDSQALASRLGLDGVPRAAAELAAHAFAREGPDACLALRGAYLLVAAGADRTLISADLLASRPLVYARTPDGGALFAEHSRDVVAMLPRTPEPNRLALTELIELGSVSAGETLQAGIGRVPTGHRLVLSAGGVSFQRYWLPRYEQPVSGTRQELAERLRDEAFAAVSRAAGMAIRPAVRLSGGLDSSCVGAALAARAAERQAPPLAFGAVFPDSPRTDERELIEASARHIGLRLTQIALRGRPSALLPSLAHMQRWGVVPATPNLFIWEPVMEQARSLGVDRMIDGEGGDEMFALAPYLIADMLRRGRPLAAWSLTAIVPGIGHNPDPRLRAAVMRRFGLGPLLPARVREYRRRRWATRMESSLLKRGDALALAQREEVSMGRALQGPTWWRMLAQQLAYGREGLDVPGHMRRHAIDEQIDSAHPFLYDVKLLEVALSTPPHLQFDPVRDRPLLRDALGGLIPEQIRARGNKADFTPLVLAGVNAESEAVIKRLQSRNAPIRAFTSTDALDRLLERREPGWHLREAGLVWRVCMVDTWLRACERPEYPGELAREIATRSR